MNHRDVSSPAVARPLFPTQLIAWGMADHRAVQWLLDAAAHRRQRTLIAGALPIARQVAEALLNGTLSIHDPVVVVQPKTYLFNLLSMHPVRLFSPPLSPDAAVQMAWQHRDAAGILLDIQDARTLRALLRHHQDNPRPWTAVLPAPRPDLPALFALLARWTQQSTQQVPLRFARFLHAIVLVDAHRIRQIWQAQPSGWTLVWRVNHGA